MENNCIRINHILIFLSWGLIISGTVLMCLTNKFKWLYVYMITFSAGRYLIFPIYPKQKEEYLKTYINRLAPFVAVSSFILRDFSNKGEKYLAYLGGIFWFFVILIFNGFKSLYYDTKYYNYGQDERIKDKYDLIGEQYHLLPVQVNNLRNLGKSSNNEDQELYHKKINELENFELIKTLHPLGIKITQKYFSRKEIKK